MPSNTRRQLEDWIKTIRIPDNAKVIDIGASQKSAFGRLGSIGKDVTFNSLDLPDPHEGTKAHIQVDIQREVVLDYDNFYDIALCFEVSEYWHRPVDAMKNIARMLKPGGTLYISFHFLYPIHNPVTDDCLRYTYSGIQKILDDSGFDVADFEERYAEKSSPVQFFQAENMKCADDVNHNVVGWLIKATKL